MDQTIECTNDLNGDQNEQQRRKSMLQSKLKYAKQPWRCEKCGVTMLLGHKSRHFKSKKHQSQ